MKLILFTLLILFTISPFSLEAQCRLHFQNVKETEKQVLINENFCRAKIKLKSGKRFNVIITGQGSSDSILVYSEKNSILWNINKNISNKINLTTPTKTAELNELEVLMLNYTKQDSINVSQIAFIKINNRDRKELQQKFKFLESSSIILITTSLTLFVSLVYLPKNSITWRIARPIGLGAYITSIPFIASLAMLKSSKYDLTEKWKLVLNKQ